MKIRTVSGEVDKSARETRCWAWAVPVIYTVTRYANGQQEGSVASGNMTFDSPEHFTQYAQWLLDRAEESQEILDEMMQEIA